jgi:hypothetical protein
MGVTVLEELSPVKAEEVERLIYTITVVNGNPNANRDDQENRLRSRCWGYYFNRADAQQVIEENQTDISELGYYRYGVLSALPEGPLAIGEELQWYEFIWNYNVPPREHDGIVIPDFVEARKIDKPPMYDHFMFGTL